MPSKANSKTSTGKPAASSKIKLPVIGRKPKEDPAKDEAAEKEADAKKTAKKVTKPKAVSLIGGGDEEKATKPKATRTRKTLPPISRKQKEAEKAEKKAAEPVEEPAEITPSATPTQELPADTTSAETSSQENDEETFDPDDKTVHLKPPFTVRDLATRLGIRPFQVIHDLMEMEIFAAINHMLDVDVAAKICEKHGFTFEKEKRKTGTGVHKPEPVVEPPPTPEPPPEEELQQRAPIVTFMGHVDHGKTSLLDSIRKTKVAAREAGGITQHIGAYSVTHEGKKITFLDTPGHEAFTKMRARGAHVTDIAVIVVAADDGMMPQTIEALNHAKAANVKIIIAINKMDATGANPDRVKTQLQERGFTTEDWGGEVIACEVSALKGIGIDHLLEMILLEAELLELKASSKAAGRATVIEAQVEPGRGPTATVIVQTGTLKVGMGFLCGDHWGKIKSLIDDTGASIKVAGPSTPVKVLGFSGLPNSGDELVVMQSEKDARTLSDERQQEKRQASLSRPQRLTLDFFTRNVGDEIKKLPIILKADVQGTLEAIIGSLDQIESKKVEVEILHGAVGSISETDVLLASASNAIIIGFNTKVENSAVKAAKAEGIEIKLYSIIYELLDQMKDAMAGLLEPETRENVIGHAEVKQIFPTSKGIVAGCVVTDGRISRTARARVVRGRQPVYDGSVATLKRFQDDAKDVRAGLECGIKLGDFNEYQVKDVIECYILEKIPQKL